MTKRELPPLFSYVFAFVTKKYNKCWQCKWRELQSRRLSPRAFWSVGGHPEKPYENGSRFPRKRGRILRIRRKETIFRERLVLVLHN